MPENYIPTERFVVYMRSGSIECRTEAQAHASASAFVHHGARNVRIAHERANGRGGFDTLSVRPIYCLGETVTIKDSQHWTARPEHTVLEYRVACDVPHYDLLDPVNNKVTYAWHAVDGPAQEERHECVSVPSADGHGAYCSICGKTLA